MRVAVTAVIFIGTGAVIVGAAALAFWLGVAPVAGVVFAVLWSVAALVMASFAEARGRLSRWVWAILGLLLGPLPAIYLSWRIAPRTEVALRGR